MVSPEDQDIVKYLISVSVKIQVLFTYSVPWLGLAISIFAIIALTKSRTRNRGKNLLIYIFKWQYAIVVIYWLNMVFIDDLFSLDLFNYSIRRNVSDPICKLTTMAKQFFYCAPSWMQVVIFLNFLLISFQY